MSTFFATCGALALTIPVGLLQSENTNAQDVRHPNQRRNIRFFAGVQHHSNCSSRNRPTVRIRQYELADCGVINHKITSCDPRLAADNACHSGRCGMAGCSTCQTSRRDFCDSSGSSNQLLQSHVDSDSENRIEPLNALRETPRDSERRDTPQQRRSNDRLVSKDAPRAGAQDQGRVQPNGIQWRSDIRAACRESSETGLPILMIFTATWCGPCKIMKAETFTNPRLVEMINTCFIPVKVDTDKNERLSRQLRIESVPTTMVITSRGNIVEQRKGFQSAEQLTEAIAGFCQRPVHRPIVRIEPRP